MPKSKKQMLSGLNFDSIKNQTYRFCWVVPLYILKSVWKRLLFDSWHSHRRHWRHCKMASIVVKTLLKKKSIGRTTLTSSGEQISCTNPSYQILGWFFIYIDWLRILFKNMSFEVFIRVVILAVIRIFAFLADRFFNLHQAYWVN